VATPAGYVDPLVMIDGFSAGCGCGGVGVGVAEMIGDGNVCGAGR